MLFLFYLHILVSISDDVMSFNSNTTGVTSEAGIANPSGTPKFTLGFYWGSCCPICSFLCSGLVHCLSFCPFSFGHCIVCPFSIVCFWLPIWYLQTCLPVHIYFTGNQEVNNIISYKQPQGFLFILIINFFLIGFEFQHFQLPLGTKGILTYHELRFFTYRKKNWKQAVRHWLLKRKWSLQIEDRRREATYCPKESRRYDSIIILWIVCISFLVHIFA